MGQRNPKRAFSAKSDLSTDQLSQWGSVWGLAMRATESIRRTCNFERGVVRDIREDLFERMGAASTEMAAARTEYEQERRALEARFQRRFEDIGSRQRAITVLLDEEMKSHGDMGRAIPNAREMRLPLQDFIVNALLVEGPLNKDEIKEMVERAGYAQAGESAGRMVHTTLMNIVRSGKIVQASTGSYRIAPIDVTRYVMSSGPSGEPVLELEDGPPAPDAGGPL